MKATGIVRRIDDLGRVVIPKEIRRSMGLREGDPLEIYTEKDGAIVFKKYDSINEGHMADFVANSRPIIKSIVYNENETIVVLTNDKVGKVRRNINDTFNMTIATCYALINAGLVDNIYKNQGLTSTPFCARRQKFFEKVL